MDKTAVELHSKGTITIRINWNQYDRQRAGGMLSGLMNKERGVVDCDISAFLVKNNGGESEVIDTVTYENPVGLNNVILHHGDNTVNGGEEEQISINLGGLSENDAVVLTLDTFKEKKQVKTGKISHILIGIDDGENKTELYKESFSGVGDRAISVGEVICKDGKCYFVPELKALNDAKAKSDLANAVKKARQ